MCACPWSHFIWSNVCIWRYINIINYKCRCRSWDIWSIDIDVPRTSSCSCFNIKSTFKKAILFWVFTVIVGALMLIVCNFLYSLWIGESVTIPITVSAAVFTYITFYNLNNCATYLLNGLNTIRVQIYTSVLFTLLYLILITLYGQYWKIEGIVICMASCYALMSLIHLYQCRLLIDQNAKGIWSK